MNVIDDFYTKVVNEKLSKKDLMDILDVMEHTNSFGSNSTTRFQLYFKMSENKNADDEVIRHLIKANINGDFDGLSLTYKIADNGSKKLFNDLWDNGIGDRKALKLWKSKYTSTKQLKEIYRDHLVVRNNPDVDKKWLQQQRDDFFKHPNAPDDIMSRNLKTEDNLVAMASNPNITSKPKAFEMICKKAKQSSFASARSKSDDILEALLTNDKLDWKTVAKGIDLITQLNSILKKSLSFFSDKKINALFEFCKHDDCPDVIKGHLYEYTNDEGFLPQIAKDIFMF